MGEVAPLRLHRRGCFWRRTACAENGHFGGTGFACQGQFTRFLPPVPYRNPMNVAGYGFRGRRGCLATDSGTDFTDLDSRRLLAAYASGWLQNAPPGELPAVRQFATLPTWLRSLRSLRHVERENALSPPPSMFFSMGEEEPNAGVDMCHAIGVERRSGPEGVFLAAHGVRRKRSFRRDGLCLPGSIHALPPARPLQNPHECWHGARHSPPPSTFFSMGEVGGGALTTDLDSRRLLAANVSGRQKRLFFGAARAETR